jgi:hypothetical protein
MAGLAETIAETRKTAAHILRRSLVGIEGRSEAEVRDRILLETKNYPELFETGWYDPPKGGAGILFAAYPFERLKYDSLRKPEFEPSEEVRFEEETVGMIYFSPVDRHTGLLGDIGFPLYKGNNGRIRGHIKNIYAAIRKVAEYAQVNMTFSDLCLFAEENFRGRFKPTRWLIVSQNLNQPTNLGHTVPGSLGENIQFGNGIEEAREAIRKNRVFIISGENFAIPRNCAFTLESRLESVDGSGLPSVYFHFIVIFKDGQKTILEDFNDIFKVVGMEYMLNQR